MKKISIDIEKAVPLGLIVNELVSNAIKHGFNEHRDGEIAIKLFPDDESKINLIVQDNGLGIPNEINLSASKTLGLQLVYMLSENQLAGSISLDRSGGTKFHIVIPA